MSATGRRTRCVPGIHRWPSIRCQLGAGRCKKPVDEISCDIWSDCYSNRGCGVRGISICLRAVWVVMVCVSCQSVALPQAEETGTASSPLLLPVARVFASAIAVRDQGTTAL